MTSSCTCLIMPTEAAKVCTSRSRLQEIVVRLEETHWSTMVSATFRGVAFIPFIPRSPRWGECVYNQTEITCNDN